MSTAKAARVLKEAPRSGLAYVTPVSDKAPKEIRRNTKYVKRKRDKNEALPFKPIPKGTYDGAELRPFDGRPGAMDFKKWPSKGLST